MYIFTNSLHSSESPITHQSSATKGVIEPAPAAPKYYLKVYCLFFGEKFLDASHILLLTVKFPFP